MRLERLAVTVAAFLVASSGSAATYYVATTGNDANPGTLSAPFRTITKTQSVVRPGDSVEVRGGVYNEVVKLGAARGTAAARIAFRSYAGENAVIDGAGSAAGTDLVQLGSAEFIDFTGFEVRNSTRLGIAIWGGKNIRILNNRIHHSVRGAIYAGYSAFGSTYDITIDGNDVYNNVLENQYHTMAGGWAQSIGVNLSDRVSITNNRVHENDGEGIVFVQTDNGVARNNTVFDNYSVGMYLDNAQYCTIDANFIYSTGNTRYYRDALPAAGIGTANESYAVANPLTDNRITNNIVVNTRWGFYYGAYEAGGGLKNTLVAHNTFYKATAAMVWLEADAHANNTIQNNIFFQSGGGVMLSGIATGTTFRANDWYGGVAGAAAGVADLVANPQLVNAGGLTAADYKLAALSPAVHAAVDSSVVTTDFFGNARTSSYDLGAHELSLALGSGAAASADSAQPPANVSAKALSATEVMVTWSVNGADHYNVYRDGARIGSVTTPALLDAGLAMATKYMYEVSAVDAGGNESLKIATYVTTASADTQAPTAPESLSASYVTGTSLTLGWAASIDNVRVTGYLVFRNGVHIATTSTIGHTDQGLTPGATYTYAVVAIDAAGNASGQSNVITVTTDKAKHRATR